MVKATIQYKDGVEEKLKFKSFAEYSAYVDAHVESVSEAHGTEDGHSPKEDSTSDRTPINHGR